MQFQQEQPSRQQKKCKVLGPCANVFNSTFTGSWRLERPSIDETTCIKCGICVQSCPAAVIDLDKNCTPSLTIDWRYCKGCGICANQCPKKCIAMVPERGEE